jgi:hypothetical protein
MMMRVTAPLTVTPALYAFLSPEERRLCRDTLEMAEWFALPSRRPEVHDYAFLVFPAAKAYEGFLRDFFFQAGLISSRDYEGKHFRIGRSFNPDLPERLRDDTWVYDDVARLCSDEVARDLWQSWIDGRNHLFHYYSHERYCLTYEQAVAISWRLLESMESALKCDWRR